MDKHDLITSVDVGLTWASFRYMEMSLSPNDCPFPDGCFLNLARHARERTLAEFIKFLKARARETTALGIFIDAVTVKDSNFLIPCRRPVWGALKEAKEDDTLPGTHRMGMVSDRELFDEEVCDALLEVSDL